MSLKNNCQKNYNQLLDQNLLELLHLCKINPCEYSKIPQKALD
ncbi:hypothetical protein ES708_14345 [subsurface metagenome]